MVESEIENHVCSISYLIIIINVICVCVKKWVWVVISREIAFLQYRHLMHSMHVTNIVLIGAWRV